MWLVLIAPLDFAVCVVADDSFACPAFRNNIVFFPVGFLLQPRIHV